MDKGNIKIFIVLIFNFELFCWYFFLVLFLNIVEISGKCFVNNNIFFKYI